MIHQIVRRLLLRGACAVRRKMVVTAVSCVLMLLLFTTLVRPAQAITPGYCIRKLGEDDLGTKVMVENTDRCNIYTALRDYPQRDAKGDPLPKQIQLRSIYAANLVKQADGSSVTGTVRRNCTPDGEPDPHHDSEEARICKHLVFYYAVPNAVFIVPQTRVLTPSELEEQRAVQEAEKLKRAAAAAKVAEEARLESEAFKRAAKAEGELKKEQKRSAGLEAMLQEIADKAYRVATFPYVVGLLALALAYAFLVTLAAAAYRFRLRPLTVDKYGYADPLEAVRDLTMKLHAVREEASRLRQAEADRKNAEATEQKDLDGRLQTSQARLDEAERKNAGLMKENASLKSNLEALRVVRPSSSDGKSTLKLLEDSLTSATEQFNDLDEAHKKLQKTQREQEQQLAALRTENGRLREAVVAREEENLRLAGQVLQLENERSEERGRSWDAPSSDGFDEEVTRVDAPSRTSVTQDSVEAAMGFAKAEVDSPDPEELFPIMAQRLASARAECELFRRALARICGLLSWTDELKTQPLDELRIKTDEIVAAVTDACQTWVASGRASVGSEARAQSTIPLVSSSDIVRIARMTDLLQERAIDIEAFRGAICDVSDASVGQCLKACIHEWAIRSERDSPAYTLEAPHEAFDLNRFLLSRLVNSSGIRAAVTSGFAEAVDRVHLACAPEFSRRAAGGSVPPSAVPQIAG